MAHPRRSRMKAGFEHRVPLSDAALAVLEQAQILRRPVRSGFPVGAAAGQTDVGHDPHQGPAG